MRVLRGWIRLAFRQAEGRYAEIAALCLKYLTAAAVCVVLTALCFRGGNPYSAGRIVFAASAIGTAVTAVYFRTAARFRLYTLSEEYLFRSEEISAPRPTVIQLIGFGLGYCAAVCSVWTMWLLPAVVCFDAGVDFYAMSGNRQHFMLLLCASFCLLTGGVLTATVSSARMGCAEYLFFSGRCGTVIEALDLSRQMTREDGGDLLMLSLLAIPCGMGIAAISRFDFSRTLFLQNERMNE